MKNHKTNKANISYIIPIILVTSCFALWGFANDITNPMVKAFSKIFRMSVTDGSLVQVAFYGGYFAMALPAALFIRRFSYKAGIMMGLALYAIGALMFFPAKEIGNYYPFLIAYFVLTCGLSFLETSCNPYILTLGDEKSATQRLNFAQSFNPMGSLLGMYVAMNFIQNKLNPMSSEERNLLPEEQFTILRDADLDILVEPYITIGIIIAIIFLLFAFTKMPAAKQKEEITFKTSIKKLIKSSNYRNGVIAQFFYVGAQIMCWTFIIQYGTHLFTSQGMEEKTAEVLSQKYNIAAMILFCCSRFICTFLMRHINPSNLLRILATAACFFTICTITQQNIYGLYSLVAVSGCMSLMFPTIYGIALGGLGNEAKVGAAGLIMAILGGSVLPPLQAMIIDCGSIADIPAINLSFTLPLICFVIIAIYGNNTYRQRYDA